MFVHGCFWHFHGCALSKLPSSNTRFWRKKLTGNALRDEVNALTLVSMGWRVAVVWECALRSADARRKFEQAMDGLAHWIRQHPDSPVIEILGD